ncbi:MAG: hypothetical protein C0392_12590 [Syntrophus sp. (in: bacteria)]|nr:hypothetical protein [Syntrophus sp. (in: bacteria)]
MKETTISDIERVNLIILLAGSALSVLIMREFKYFFSFAVGSAIMTLNFRFLKNIIMGLTSGSGVRKWDLIIKLPLKFIILAGLVAAVIMFGDINVVFFLLGLSTVFISILVNQIICMVSPAAKRRQKDGA